MTALSLKVDVVLIHRNCVITSILMLFSGVLEVTIKEEKVHGTDLAKHKSAH